jgi:hypothetical protein
MNAKTKEAITKHGLQLLAIFPNATEQDPVALCKKLRRIETKAHRATTCLCNTNTLDLMELSPFHYRHGWRQSTEEEQDAFFEKIEKALVKLLGPEASEVVHINHDPRGHAFKIKDEVMRGRKLSLYSDLGGYGILAPDLTA